MWVANTVETCDGMKVVSWNVNGIRAAAGKGLIEKMEGLQADVFCFQETKATEEQVAEVLAPLVAKGWKLYASSAERKGYSGTAILTKNAPLEVVMGLPQSEHNTEGRLVAVQMEHAWIVTAYVPNSGNELARLTYRAAWDIDVMEYLKTMDQKKPVIFCGDLNVAHQPIDLARPKSNYNKTAGYTQIEIDGFSAVLASGFVDTYRALHPDTVAYSWWSYRGGAKEANIGWRLDYVLVSERLFSSVTAATIHPEVEGSDHCPVSAQFAF